MIFKVPFNFNHSMILSDIHHVKGMFQANVNCWKQHQLKAQVLFEVVNTIMRSIFFSTGKTFNTALPGKPVAVASCCWLKQ